MSSVSSRRRPRRASSRSSSRRRHTKYHKLASRNKLGSILEAQEDHDEEQMDGSLQEVMAPRRRPRSDRHRILHEAKVDIMCELAKEGGDCSSVAMERNLHKLAVNYDLAATFDPRETPRTPSPFAVCGPGTTRMEGTWMSLSKPNFTDCLGTNENGDYMYTLGRMSFDMFQPTELRCSIQGTFNEVKLVDSNDRAALENVPSSLKADALHGKVPLRTYTVVTAFTILPGMHGEEGPNQGVEEPIEGIMTTYGYCLPYPTGNRFSIWFSHGCIEVGDDLDSWHEIFGKESLPGRTLAQKSKLLVAKLLMGAETSDEMDENGKISYKLHRPMAANIDLVYMDEMTRIMRAGKSGTIYVATRVQDVDDVSSDESSSILDDEISMRRRSKWDDPPIRRVRTDPSARPRRPAGGQRPSNSSPKRPERSQSPSADLCTSVCPQRPTPMRSSDESTMLDDEISMRRRSKWDDPPIRRARTDPSARPCHPAGSQRPSNASPKRPERSQSPSADLCSGVCPQLPTPMRSSSAGTSPKRPTRCQSPTDNTLVERSHSPKSVASPALRSSCSLSPKRPVRRRSRSPSEADDESV